MTDSSSVSITPAPMAPTPPGRSALREILDVLASMRFAIALLSLICIASIIGTVIKQHEPSTNYVNQFGPFWAPVFDRLGLFSVYSAAWFLAILAFLVVSVSLCITRNAPKILQDLKTFKEGMREQSLKAFHHKAEGQVSLQPDETMARIAKQLQERGWKAKAQVRNNGLMLAARKGSANKLGYLAAHSSIVLICLGGLMDGDVVVRGLMLLKGITPYTGGGMIRDVGPQHRLPESNPTYRGNLFVAEGGRGSVVMLNQPEGVVLQEIPFEIELKKFTVDFYDTGMPKLFASDIVIHDKATGESIATRVKVNEPASHRGVLIYQSSFEDGGSALTLEAVPLSGGKALTLEGNVGGSTTLTAPDGKKLNVEFTSLRVFNVENLAGQTAAAIDVRKVDLVSRVEQHLGSGARSTTQKELRNVGPSVQYKLRDESGQAKEFHNYMVPVELDGQRVLLAGVRDTPAEAFRFLRIPVDETDSASTWLATRAALNDPAMRDAAVARYAALATPADKPELTAQLTVSARRALGLFSGAEALPGASEEARGGLPAVSAFIEANVPEAERAKASDVLIRILNGSLLELTNGVRTGAGKPRLAQDDAALRYMTQTVLSLSDAAFYPAPVLLQLRDFKQVQASVFQLTRSPGKFWVYLGSALLILGVFAMLYVRERRLWVWLQDAHPGTQLTLAMSTTRQTLDADREFDALKLTLMGAPAPKESSP